MEAFKGLILAVILFVVLVGITGVALTTNGTSTTAIIVLGFLDVIAAIGLLVLAFNTFSGGGK